MAAIDLPPVILLSAAGVLGLVVGSFLNVVIRRLPIILERRWLREARAALDDEEAAAATEPPLSLALPPSHCLACGQALKGRHKIPVLSYLLLRGRCGFCAAPISRQYPAVELLALFVAVVIVAHFGVGFQSLAALLFSWTLIALAFIDCNEQLLPDELTLGLLWGGLLANAFGLFADAGSAIIGAAAGYGTLWLICHGMRLATGRQGLGHGDMKLLAAIGAWCGWQALPFIMLAASVTGLVVSAALLVARKMSKDERMPFGPYLAAAGWLFFIYAFVYHWTLPVLF